MNRIVAVAVLVLAGFLTTLGHAVEPHARATMDMTFSNGTLNIIIANLSARERTFDHPGNRSAISFVLFDEWLNVIAPVGIGKADPPSQKFNLKPGEVFKYSVHPYINRQQQLFFSYVSDTAWFGYPLEKGKRYRILAVYRPWGSDSSGITSNEMSFQF